MRTLFGDNVLCVDVDDTLITWSPVGDLKEPVEQSDLVEIVIEDQVQMYKKFEDNIASLKTHHHKGHTVVVWSGSGFEWATTVVRALGLTDYVDLVMAKPRWLLDDMKPSEFMPTPYWGAGDPGKTKLK